MPTAKQAKVEIETGQTLHDFAVMTDAGDHEVYTISGGTVWSGKSGYAPTVRPNGIVSGRNLITPDDGAASNKVDIAAFTAYCKGTLLSVSATSAIFTRPTTGDKACVYSVCMASDGSITVIKGTISAGATFTETRNAAGGPPLIPVNDVELGQIRITDSPDAVVASSEIYQVPGQHTERYDFPSWKENNIGDGESAATSAQKNAYIKFASALPLSHTGPVAKKTYIKYYSPIFTEIEKTFDFKGIFNTHSVSSQEYYRGTIASTAQALGQGGFTAFLNSAINDTLVNEKDNIITVRFYPDENKTPYALSQGYIGVDPSWPADGQIQAAVTITGEQISALFAS